MSAYSNMSSFRLVALIISALLLGCEVCGNQWVATNLPCLFWPDVAVSSNGTFVAAVNNVGGIWLSYDMGRNWTNSGAPTGPWSAISMSSTGNNMVAVQNPGNIFLSRNNGNSWEHPTNDSIVGEWMDVACSSTCEIIVAAMIEVGVYVSKNHGNSWVHSIVSNSISWQSVASDSSGEHLAACAGGGEVAVSNNSGDSWFYPSIIAAVWVFVTIDVTGQYYYLGSLGSNMYVSVDNGTTWTQSSLVTIGGYVRSIGVGDNRQNISVLNNFENGYFYFSHNGGTTWSLGIENYLEATSLAMSATGATTALGNEFGGVYMSYGFGSGVVTPTMFSSLEFVGLAASETGQVLVGAAKSSLWISTDYGQDWKPIFDLPVQYWSGIVMNGTGGFIAAVNQDMLFRSFDTGLTWTQTELPFSVADDIACDSTGAKMVAVSQNVGIYLSDDYGDTWTQSYALDKLWILVACDATRTNIYAAVWDGMIYASNDGGSSWYTSNPLQIGWLSLSTSGNGQIVAAGTFSDFSIVVSQDAGKTWLESDASSNDAYSYISLATDYTGEKWLASGQQGLFQSDNYGLNWVVVEEFPAIDGNYALVAMSGDGSKSVVSTYFSGVYVDAPSPSSAPSSTPTNIPTHHPSTIKPSFQPTYVPSNNPTLQPSTASPTTDTPSFSPTFDPTNVTILTNALSLPASLSALNHAYTSVLCVFLLALLTAVVMAIIWCVKNRNVSDRMSEGLLVCMEAGMWTATLVSQLLFVIVALSTSGSNPRGLLALGVCWVALRSVGTIGNVLLIQALCPINGWWSSGVTGWQGMLLLASLWQSAVSRYTGMMQDVTQVTRTLHWDLMICTMLLVIKITFAASLNDDGQNDDDTAIATGYRTAGRATEALAVLCSLWQWLFLLGVRGYYHYHPVLKYGRDIEADVSGGGLANALQL